jgi:hypothetical protein
MQELLSGTETQREQAFRFDQVLQCTLKGAVVVENCQKH